MEKSAPSLLPIVFDVVGSLRKNYFSVKACSDLRNTLRKRSKMENSLTGHVKLANPTESTLSVDKLCSSSNTIHKGEYHWMANLLFDWFGLEQSSKQVKTVVHLTKAKQLNPNT